MKITIYALAADTQENGTTVDICFSKRELLARQREILESAVESDDGDTSNRIKALLDEGHVSKAWDLFDSGDYGNGLDTFSIEERVLHIPTVARFDVIGGVCHLRHKSKAVTVSIKDHDNKPATVETYK